MDLEINLDDPICSGTCYLTSRLHNWSYSRKRGIASRNQVLQREKPIIRALLQYS
jgi:hypothetical protein